MRKRACVIKGESAWGFPMRFMPYPFPGVFFRPVK